jgi:alpha-1,2-mannosyltransferase
VKLILLGGARHEEDKDLVESLKKETVKLGLSVGNDVEFVVNAKYDELCTRLSTSSVGIHTMWNEHFGISVVEMMAAGGCVPSLPY